MAETSKTVDQALHLLASLRSEGPATATVLARRLGTSRTVVSRLARTLEDHDMVRRTEAGFDLGFGLLDLVEGLAPDLRGTARPQLETIAAELRETVVLAVVDGDDAVAIDQVVPANRVVRIHYHPGSRHSLTEAAHGRAILAFSAAPMISRLVATHADPVGLQIDLDDIRESGHAITRDELEPGVSGIAAPVLGEDGHAVASIGVVAPTARFPHPADVGPLVIAAADAVTAQLTTLTAVAIG